MIVEYILGYASLTIVVCVVFGWLMEEYRWFSVEKEDTAATIIGLTACIAIAIMVIIGIFTLIGLWIQ